MNLDAQTSTIAFRAFSATCSIAGTAAECVIDRNVEVYDENGQVIGKTITADLLAADAAAAEYGDTLIVGDDTFTFGRKLADDGFIQRYEVHEQ